MPDAVHVGSGKVRELYALDDERLLLVASDRISTFDVVLPTEIPDKGRVLTGLSAFWFARTKHIVANHLLALRAGIIIADTKFELGIDSDGKLVLGDEALTPDSSRFWPGETYEPGRAQDSFDKQFVRDYCETTGWDKTDPGPELPDDVVQVTRAKYHEAFERLTTIPFPTYHDDPSVVLG